MDLEDNVRELFKKYNPLCGYVKCSHDDVSKGNVYTVTLATDVKFDDASTSSGSGGGSSSGFVGRILDEPRALILLILLVCVCAAFTTTGQSWLTLGRGLSALLNPALSRQ